MRFCCTCFLAQALNVVTAADLMGRTDRSHLSILLLMYIGSAYEMNRPVNSNKEFLEFVRDTFLYGFFIFVLLALIGRVSKAKFADSLFEVWAVSTVLLAPFVWGIKNLVKHATKW
jgi:hypothetical protein